MLNVQVKNAARVAAAAGLGLTLAFAAAPVVAMANDAAVETPADGQEGATVVNISTATQLADAIKNQGDGQVWNLAAGTYDLDAECLAVYADMGTETHTQGNWYFPIFKNNITINGNGATITSSVKSDNGAWSTRTSLPSLVIG